MRRRELLTGIVGVVSTAALGRPAALATPPDPSAGVEKLLYGTTTAEPVPLAALRPAVTQARGAFQAARYPDLSLELPALIATATATRDHAAGDEQRLANALLADVYTLASSLMVKLNDDPLAWATADRALQAAAHSEDPLVLAGARRSVATVLRRMGRAGRAHALLLTAAEDIRPARDASGAQLSMYGTLLQVAAYTAAVDGNRADAHELITEAAAAATRLGRDANHRHTAFGPTNVALYQVSIAQVLGDNGTAIEHAATIRPGDIPTPERQGRYWIDVARAYHQWGKHEQCYRALLSAEHAAPAEVRYRPPVRRITVDLLRADRRRALPGLHAFAKRVGIETGTSLSG